jgi:hypothetical protein
MKTRHLRIIYGLILLKIWHLEALGGLNFASTAICVETQAHQSV